MQALSDSYEFDGWDVNVPAKHPLYQFGRRRERAREFVFTRKDDAIFEAALREKFPDILIFLRAPGYVLTFERVRDLYADNRRGERWLILPREGRNWGPLVEVVSDPSSPKVQACLRNLPGRWLAYSRSSWQLVEGGLLNRRTAFDWPYLGIGALRGQVWDLDPDLENVKSFYRTVLRIVSRIATNQVKHGSRLMNEAYGSDYRSMADLKGKEIRGTGGGVDVLKSLGATPVGMPITEVPQSLQTGVIDGYMTSIEVIKEFKLGEMVKHVTEYPMNVLTFAVVMNKSKWESLPKDVQDAIDAISRDLAVYAGDLYDTRAAEAIEWAKSKHGIVFHKLSDAEAQKWAQATAPLIDQWVKKQEAAGLPARDFLNRLQQLRETIGK